MGKRKPRVSYETKYWVLAFDDPKGATRVYEVLIDGAWVTLDPERNILAQTHNMRGYRALTVFGDEIFTIK